MRSYNQTVADCIDGVREFLVIHYCAPTATIPSTGAPPRHADPRRAPPSGSTSGSTRLPERREHQPDYHGFESYSYSVMLLGLNYKPGRSLPALDHMDDANALHAFRALRERTERLVATLPSQLEYLTHLRAETCAVAA